MKKILLLILVLGVGGCWFAGWDNPVDEESAERVAIEIPSGSSVSEIANLLEDANVIRSPFAFKRAVKHADAEATLHAGSFVMRPSMTLEEIINVLQGAQETEEKITIPEGFTVAQIDELLAEKGLIEKGDILRCAFNCDFSKYDFIGNNVGSAEDGYGSRIEGYVFPDTYFINSQGFQPEDFLKRTLDTFERRIVDGLSEEIASSGRSLSDVIIMASLIEEETITDDERSIVSGILWKRLNEIGLGVDATVRYVTGNSSDPLTRSQLDIDSPYNTRKYRGLPPTPIASPGLKSIEAAINPEASPYWYYLHGADGQIRYAETNDQHNANKEQYL